MKRLVLLLVLVGLVAGSTWAIRNLPWWALLLIFVALVVIAKLTLKKLLKALILIPFKAKGAVLHGATAQVHSVTPAAAPTKTEHDDEPKDNLPRRYFTLDVTIQPKDATGNFSCWELGELRLARPDFHIDPHSDDSTTDDDSCNISELQYEENGLFKHDEGFKFQGPQRLKMTLGVREGVNSLKFQYYFEEFGSVQLPAAPLQAAA